MLAVERPKIILEYLKKNEVATTKELSALTGASLATLRRDLNSMENEGLLIRTHGGAQRLPAETPVSASYPNAAPSSDAYLELKDAIAKRSVQLIHSNDIVFIGAGMTCNLLCRYLNASDQKGITVVTTNVTAVMELAHNPSISILMLGGNVHAGTNHVETLDEYTVQALRKLYFDKAFFTVDGIDLDYGYSIINRAQIPLYNHLLKNAANIYLLANDGKFNRRTFTYLCDMDSIPNIITNSSVEEAYLTYYRDHNIHVVTV